MHTELCSPVCAILWDVWLDQSAERNTPYTLRTKEVVFRCVLLRCMFSFESWADVFLHTSHEMGRSPLCTLLWVSGLVRLVKFLLHILHEKNRPGHLKCRTALCLWVNDVTHISKRETFSLLLPLACPDKLFLRENVFLHISHESKYSSLHTSVNSALCSPRSSSAFMQWAASVVVAFISTLWNKEKLNQDL